MPKKTYDKTAIKMKKAGIKGGVLPILQKGEWQQARDTSVPGKPKKKKGTSKCLALSQETLIQIGKERAAGATLADLAEKYQVSNSYISNAVSKLFLNNKVGREVLKGVLLEGAIATGMQARERMPELTAMQSVVATGILSSRFVEMDKHISATPIEVDYNELAGLSEDLKQLKELVGDVVDPNMGTVLDVESTVTQPTGSAERA